jgi:HD superfamily phosphohydrolase
MEKISKKISVFLSIKIWFTEKIAVEVHMKTQLPEEKVFKDPVHKYIYVQDQLIWELINTREFQRLRRIRQLGTSFLTFHGAEHSRFNHSLGVYEVARKIISQFERNNYDQWNSADRLLVLCSALLHDLGHAPFSHSTENLFGTDHEKWSCALITGDTDVQRILKQVGPDFPAEVASVIAKTHTNKLVVSMVSSQLDADRMDYLLRDAYYTGVNYGTFDLDRILRVIRPHEGHIVVKASGMHAVEDYLMSRYQMYWQVYLHPVTRSGEIVLRNIFRRARDLHGQAYRFPFLPDSLAAMFDGTLDLAHYLQLDEPLIQTTLQQWQLADDAVLSDLCRRFNDRKLFKYVSARDLSVNAIAKLAEQFAELGIPPEYYLETDDPGDQPYHEYSGDDVEEKMPIYIIDENHSLQQISKVSEIVRVLSSVNQEKQPLLFYPADLLEERGDVNIEDWMQEVSRK